MSDSTKTDSQSPKTSDTEGDEDECNSYVIEKINQMQQVIDELKEQVEDLNHFCEAGRAKEAKKRRTLQFSKHLDKIFRTQSNEVYQREFRHAEAEYDRDQLLEILNYGERHRRARERQWQEQNQDQSRKRHKSEETSSNQQQLQKGNIVVPEQEQRLFQQFLNELDQSKNTRRPDLLCQDWLAWCKAQHPPAQMDVLVIRHATTLGKVLKQYFPTIRTRGRTTKVGLCNAQGKWESTLTK